MFGESTYPDLDHWIGGVGWGVLPTLLDDFTNCNLKQLLEDARNGQGWFLPGG